MQLAKLPFNIVKNLVFLNSTDVYYKRIINEFKNSKSGKIDLTNEINLTVSAGSSTIPGVVSGYTYSILFSFEPSITINSVGTFQIQASCSASNSGYYLPTNTNSPTISITNEIPNIVFNTPFNINNQKDGIYVNNYTSPDLTQRDTTSAEYFTSAGGYATNYGNMNYDAAYRQTNNETKENIQKEQAKIDKVDAEISVEEVKQKQLQDEAAKLAVKVANEELTKFFNDRFTDKQ